VGTTVPSPKTSTTIMNRENQMNIVIKEFNKFNKNTLLSKTRMPENVRFPILKAERKATKVYMPERYTSLQDDIINEMVYGKYNIHKSNDNLYLEISQFSLKRLRF